MDAEEEQYCCDGSCPDDIVISGMAGRFPMCDNVEEFNDALLNKKDILTPVDGRWEPGTFSTATTKCGFLNDLSRFDTKLFRIPASTLESMDPEQRITLEVGYEAICDSGYDPRELRGRNIGVYCCTYNSDSMNVGFKANVGALCSEFLRANRLSFCFDFRGPSYCINSACGTSGVALYNVFRDIQSGTCEAAVISGVQIILNPELQKAYEEVGIISDTSICMPFEERANGSVRSEAVVALFIQKASAARRNYATILEAKSGAGGFLLRGISVPSFPSLVKLFDDMLKAAKLTPDDFSFVECHGTGTPVGDPVEIASLKEIFCKNRKEPLLIGSVKSSIGHTEAVSGICSVVKMLLSFQCGMISPHCNFEIPNSECPALLDGSIKVITEPTPIKGDIVAVNSFGFGGCISQVFLRRNRRKQPQGATSLSSLVLMCSTCEDGLKSGLDYVQQRTLGREFFVLLQKLAFRDPGVFTYRGFTIVGAELPTETKLCTYERKPVWYVMTGMGCQWPGMGTDLMAVETFARSIHKSAQVLKPFGIDLLEIIKPGTNHLMQNRHITPAFVSICAIQIALIDVLNEVDIVPDGIIGHSAGELACAYADGCCTAEQTILSAYWRGRSVELANLPDGGMAAVGMTWEDAKKQCPKNVYPACHNAEDSITISGLKEPLEEFVSQLKKGNIFSRIVDTYGFAFHCSLLLPAAPILQKNLEEVIKNPKPRNPRWLSTSYPPEEWSKPEANIANSHYFVNNLKSNVHFAEALSFIPKDAIVIEIGPHALLQPLLKRVIGPKATYLGTMKRHENNVNTMLSSLGQLYCLGLDTKIERLYPRITYPVSESTATLSNAFKWDHSKSHKVALFNKKSQGSMEVTINTLDKDKYILDHIIDGRSLYPAAGYIYLAWQALAEQMNKPIDELPIFIEDFKIHRASILSSKDMKKYSISILNAGGEFEITEGSSIISTGKISTSTDFILPTPSYTAKPSSTVTGREFYNELRISGYEYGPNFQCLAEIDIDGSQGLLTWTDKWIPYLDAHLLFYCNVLPNEDFRLPTGAISIKINPIETNKYLQENNNQLAKLPVNFHISTECCLSPGIEIRKLKMESASHSSLMIKDPVLEKVEFVSHLEDSALTNTDREVCVEYMNICNELIKNVSCKELKMQSTLHRVSEFQSRNSEKCVLLNTLQNALMVPTTSDYIKDLKDVFRRYVNEIGEDLLYKTLFNEYPLAHLLSTIVENSSGKLSVAEVSNKKSTVLPFVENLIKYHTAIKPSFTLFHSQPEILGSDVFLQTKVNVQAFEYFRVPKVTQNQDLVIGSFFFGNKQILQESIHFLASLLKPKGFLLLQHREEISAPEAFLCSLCDENLKIQSQATIRHIFSQEKLSIVCKKSDSFGSTLYLLRLLNDSNTYVDTVVHVKDGRYKEWVDQLKDTFVMTSEKNNARVWIVAEDSPFNGVIGMVKCLRKELGGENIRCVFLMRDATTHCLPKFSLTDPFFSFVVQNNLLINIYKNGAWGAYHATRIPADLDERKVDHSCLTIKKCGDLSTFHWIESPIKQLMASSEDEQLVRVCYSALNFRDVMQVSGKISVSSELNFGKYLIGFEYSGVTAKGQRVMGFTQSAGIASEVLKGPESWIEVPDHWSLEEAATVPVVYFTCYTALIVTAHLKDHESILIHSGSGGIGIAAIRIALSLNCNVFVTVGTNEKRLFLLKEFPQLKDQHIGYSRDTSFEDLILEKTNGRGVDVVLNSLADDKFIASVRCVAPRGRFIEIGKYDLALDRKMGLGFFLNDTSFHGVHLDTMLDLNGNNLYQEIKCLLTEGIKKGIVQPLTRTVFQRNEVEKAFRYMTAGKHIGKVLLKVRDEPMRQSIPGPLDIKVIPNTYFYKSKCYIVVGGLGGFGIELVKWLLLNGAHNIVITSRSGITTGYHQLCMLRWKKSGFNVIVSLLNVAKKEEAQQLLQNAEKIAPVGGIFNSALVLKDGFLENQNYKSFEEACAPKAEATKNLDELSRRLCLHLDFFVCFSSMSGEKGNAGQSNYGYANSVMERICEGRRQNGLHGLAVQWGIIGDVGVVYRNMGEDAVIAGLVSQRVRCCLEVLGKFLQRKEPVLSSYILADSSKKSKTTESFMDHLTRLLGYKDSREINIFQTLAELGIDSIVGIEIQQILELQYDIHLNIRDLLKFKIAEIKALTESSCLKISPASAETILVGQFKFPECIVPKQQVILLNNKCSSAVTFIVGHSEQELLPLHSLASMLDETVYGLVCAANTPTENLASIAEAYLQEITKLSESRSIHLIGYRASAGLALELAGHLERRSKNVAKLTILDGSLELVNNLSLEENPASLKELEITYICDFLSQFTKADLVEVQKDLDTKQDSNARTSYVVELLVQVQEKLGKLEISNVLQRYLGIRDVLRKLNLANKLAASINIIEASGKLLFNDVAIVKSTLSKISGKVLIDRIPGGSDTSSPEFITATATLLKN